MHSARTRLVLTYIAANVRRIRTDQGMTQERLAEATDVDLTFLQRIEAGRANPSVAVLVAIADALKVTPGSLFRPATMPEIKRGRPPKARAAAPASEPPAAAPTEPMPEPADAAPAEPPKAGGRKASARKSSGEKASAGKAGGGRKQ